MSEVSCSRPWTSCYEPRREWHARHRAYLDLRRLAAQNGRPFDELLQFYALEGFLTRLTESRLSDGFVLKGGVLLAALGQRRATRDIDLAGRGVTNDRDELLRVVIGIARATPTEDDGLRYHSHTASARSIRDEEEYSGVRITMGAELATARPRLALDINVGDPIQPPPQTVRVPRVLGGEPITMSGYPIAMVLAEKIVTATQRGVANTRWRDFADVWTLRRAHRIDGDELQRALATVAEHRNVTLSTMSSLAADYPQIAQHKWQTWSAKQGRPELPDSFAEVLAAVAELADPALHLAADGKNWDPARLSWT